MPRQRGHGEGSIRQRADGLWEASIELARGPDGKRRRKSLYGKTRREVSEKLKAVLHEQQQGLPIPVGRQTVGQFLNEWLEGAARKSLRASTYATYSSHIKNHLIPALGRIPLSTIEPQQVQAFLTHKLDSGLSERTVADVYAILRRALNQAVRWNLIPRNPVTLIDPPRFHRREMAYLTPDQARGLLTAVKGDRLEALYSVALALGLRRGEALGLAWKDVDLDNGVLYVRQALQRIQGALQIVEPKTKSSRRSINLPAVTVAALRAHRIRQLEDRLAAGERWQESGLVFTTRTGTPVDPRNFKRDLDRVLQRAGLPHVRIHDLRHTAASLLLSQGVELRVIAEILGHSRIGTTADLYIHLYEPQRREAAAKMDALLSLAD